MWHVCCNRADSTDVTVAAMAYMDAALHMVCPAALPGMIALCGRGVSA